MSLIPEKFQTVKNEYPGYESNSRKFPDGTEGIWKMRVKNTLYTVNAMHSVNVFNSL